MRPSFVIGLVQIFGIIALEMIPCEKAYKCLSSVTQRDCLENQFLEMDLNEGCCPYCRGGLGILLSYLKI